MKLYLVQHGEACNKAENPDRPLTNKGQRDVENIAAFLKNSAIKPERIIHSGKLRAQQTAECLANVLAPNIELESSGIINPNDDPKAFSWQDDSWDHDTLVVGHLPFLSKLVSLLLIENEINSLVSFQPGSVICLNCDEDKNWKIEWMIRPELLTK